MLWQNLTFPIIIISCFFRQVFMPGLLLEGTFTITYRSKYICMLMFMNIVVKIFISYDCLIQVLFKLSIRFSYYITKTISG